MCLILDASKFGDFLNQKNADMQPVRDWHDEYGNSFVYSLTKKLKRELKKSTRMESNFREWERTGKAHIVDKQKVINEQARVKKDLSIVLKSDDEHIIALALASEVRLLVSGDEKLKEDFNYIVNGDTYMNKEDVDLLTPCTFKP